MQPLAPKTIRIIAIVLASVGGLIFLANVLAVFVLGVLDMPGRMERMLSHEGAPLPFAAFRMMHRMVPVVAVTALLGLLLGVGSLFLMQFRRWALTMVSMVLVLMIVGLWILPFLLRPYLQETIQTMEQAGLPKELPVRPLIMAGQFFKAFFYTAPLATVLVLLNRKSSRAHFR